jgi:hypothetical protein
MILIFNNSGDFIMTANIVPSSHQSDDFIRCVLADNEEFEPGYAYTCVDGTAIKGAPIPVDTVEEARMEAEYQATKYQQDRKYPPIGDQLDALFHAGAFPADMAAQIQAVKDANPKPVA